MMDDFSWTGFDESNPAHLTLQGFLVLDVQDQPELAEEISNEIKSYRTGQTKSYEGSGNGYEFECRADGFYIACLYEDVDDLSPVTVDYETTLQALNEWQRHCQSSSD